jgi:hypothetical protein
VTSADDSARQQILDEDNLRLLRIGYFISAGLTLFGSLIVLVYTFFLSFVFTEVAKTSGAAGMPPFVGRLVGALGVVIVLLLIGLAVLKFLTGQQLKKRRSRIFCMVIAGIECLSIPYGTFLGVCTFIVLLRPTVERSFEDVQS